jgi:hypothetical protein
MWERHGSTDMRMRAKQCREQSASAEDAAARVLLEATADEWISVAELYDNLRMRVLKLTEHDPTDCQPHSLQMP